MQAGFIRSGRSLTFVVAGDVDIKILVLVVLVLEEHVFVVLAQLLVDFDILDVGDVVTARFLGVGILEGDDLGRVVLGFLFLGLVLFLDCAWRRSLGEDRLLEIGARIGFAGIGRNDRVLVEVVELLAGIRIGPLGAAFVVGHSLILSG